MSVHNCHKCKDTGEDMSNFCTCGHGRKLAQQERAPVWPGAILEEASVNIFVERMELEGRKQCWVCDLWKPKGDWARMCPDCKEEY